LDHLSELKKTLYGISLRNSACISKHPIHYFILETHHIQYIGQVSNSSKSDKSKMIKNIVAVVMIYSCCFSHFALSSYIDIDETDYRCTSHNYKIFFSVPDLLTFFTQGLRQTKSVLLSSYC